MTALTVTVALWSLDVVVAQELTLPDDTEAELGAVEEQEGVDPYLELVGSPGRFKLLNRSSFTIINLKRGQVEISALPHGAWDGDERPTLDLFDKELPLRTLGQFQVSEWGAAMSETLPMPPRWLTMSPEERRAELLAGGSAPSARQSERSLSAQRLLAEVHLRTAGLSPPTEGLSEVIMTTGTPLIEPNVIALRKASPEETVKWLEGEAHPLQTALVAQASLFAPPKLLLKELFKRLDPQATPSELERWRPAGYERLQSAYELTRDAFERHGAEALPALISHAGWSKDRGFEDPLLAFILGSEAELLKALKSRDKGSSFKALNARLERVMGDDLDALYARFFSAQAEGGSVESLRRAALELGYRLHRVDQRPEVSLSARALCGTLDGATQSALNQNQLLAARSYLELATRVCHGSPFFMMRGASLMSAIGDRGYFRGDFESAQHWYRAALMLRDDPMSRVKFIDTLSQLALRANVEGDFKRARSLIDEARDWDSTALPHRELLALADQLMPRADHRARLGLILLIAVLGVIVTIRLLKIFQDPEPSTRG